MFGLFSKQKSLQKTIDRATHTLSQSPDRWGAMEKLAENGSEEALFALCRRFSFNYDKTIEDQQEKDWTVQTLVAKGPAALAPLRRYMKSAKSLGYPLMVLSRITKGDESLEVIDELLADEEPGYVRDPKRRSDIIEWLADWDAPEAIFKRVAPYLEDFDENVRFKAVETLGLNPYKEAAEPLAKALVREEEESQRLKLRIASVLAENAWPLGPHLDAVKPMLNDLLADFKLEHNALKKKS